MARLGHELRATLELFAGATAAASTPAATASDFEDSGLTQDELTRLLARIARD
jgi:hypothetical protein